MNKEEFLTKLQEVCKSAEDIFDAKFPNAYFEGVAPHGDGKLQVVGSDEFGGWFTMLVDLTPLFQESTYEIWSEGYRATGEAGQAMFHGKHEGFSFQDACRRFFTGNTYYCPHRNTHWGCQLFDNEEDARKSFG